MVRAKGLEPSRFSALASKTNVSTIPPRPQPFYFNANVFKKQVFILDTEYQMHYNEDTKFAIH